MRSGHWVMLAALGVCLSVSSVARGDDAPIGWATVNDYGQNGTTGGAGGPTVTVATTGDFYYYVSQTTPYIIQVVGDITVGAVNIKSDKTIIGLGTDATLRGRLGIAIVKNVIIRNLNIRAEIAADEGWDAISIVGSHHIWVDHCALFNAPDGLCDITSASDYVTVSWCKFYYTTDYVSSHRLTVLIGHSDDATGDVGKLRITMHNNWWAGRCSSRMPSVRYGKVHLFNNHYNSPGNNYCILSRISAQVLVENNYFLGVSDPHDILITTGTTGLLKATGNIYQSTSGSQATNGPEGVFVPPYTYTMEAAANVPAIVTAGAGPQLPNVVDTTAPTPNPMTWASVPAGISTTAISMTATTGSDENGVLYRFTCHTAGGHSSGWQGSPTYIDTGLAQGVSYAYSVVARDVLMNQTAASGQASATVREPSTATPIKIDFLPETSTVAAGFLPDYGYVYGDRGNGKTYGWNNSHISATRERTENSDLNLNTIVQVSSGGVWEMAVANGEYYVEVVIGDARYAATQTLNVEGVNYWTSQYLAANDFRKKTQAIQVSDGRLTIDQGSGGSTPALSVRIPYLIITPTAAPDEEPPMPNPMTWAAEPNATGATAISMTATTATDDSSVEYYFENMTDNSHDSGWQSSATYTDSGLDPDSAYAYRVKARDLSENLNETLWSDPLSAITLRYDCTVTLPADLSGNCQVDFFDYAMFATAWSYGTPDANLYIDGVLDIRDAAVFAEDWLVCGRVPADECWSQ